MNPKINIIVEEAEEMTVQSALETIPELKLEKIGESRGLALGATKALTFVAEFIGDSAKVTDALLEQATSQLAGGSFKVQYCGIIIEVTNVNRSQLADLLDKAIQGAKEVNQL